MKKPSRNEHAGPRHSQAYLDLWDGALKLRCEKPADFILFVSNLNETLECMEIQSRQPRWKQFPMVSSASKGN